MSIPTNLLLFTFLTSLLLLSSAALSPSPQPSAADGPTLPLSPTLPPVSSPPAPPPSDLVPPPSPSPGMSPASSPSTSPSKSPLSPTLASAPEPVAADVGRSSNMEAEEGGGGGMSGGKKAGVVIGVVMAAALVGIGAVVYKKRQDNIRRSQYGNAVRRELL